MAKVVSGPMAMRVMVSGGSVSRMRRISRWDGEEEGMKRLWVVDGGSVWVAEAAVEVKRVPGGGGSKRCFQVSDGEE